MEKDIKDYLHLYLGCEVINMELNGNPVKFDAEFLSGMGEDEIGNDWEMFKPILRPLSDLTEEEMKAVVLLNYNVAATIKDVWLGESGIVGFSTSGLTGGGRIDLLASNPETFRYVLSKHFDLFGLIESGLAIDKTKL